MQRLTDSIPITRLRRFLIPTSARSSNALVMFWLVASLGFAAIYAVPALRQAFSSIYVVQDDARQHVFWMRRFLDPGLFPHDLIADYYQSIEPPGFAALYRLMAGVGIDPIFLSKLLPMALGLMATTYCFGACMRWLPVPSAAFVATLLLNQNLWTRPDLVSGTPRAFQYPLFLGFLYYLLGRSLLPCLLVLALQGLFYPQLTFISVGTLILSLVRWKGRRLRLSRDRGDLVFCASGVAVALFVMVPYAVRSSEFGPVVTATEARALPEFLPGGRWSFFNDDPWSFWLTGKHSGILRMALKPPLVWIGTMLPMLLRYRSRFPLAQRVSSGVGVLPRVVLASIGMFFAAHALLFRLYIPNRYIGHSLPMVMALASGIALTVLLDGVFYWAEQGARPSLQVRQLLALGSAALLGIALIPLAGLAKMTGGKDMHFNYKAGRVPSLYEYFSRQPKGILIASLASEVNNLTIFSRRSILIGSEYALPWHVGYYGKIHQRAVDLIRAQYSQDLAEARHLIRTYGVDFLVLEHGAFTPQYVVKNPLIRQFQPGAEETLVNLEQGVPALGRVAERCSVFRTRGFIVLQADCIEKLPEE